MTIERQGQTYVDYMTPAFIEAMTSHGRMPLRLAVMDALQTLDWDSSGLPDKDFSTDLDDYDEKGMEPRKYATALARIAFEDARTVIDYCKVLQDDEHIDTAEFKEIMLQSKKELLILALLPDHEKSNIFKAIQLPEIKYLYAPDIETEAPVVMGINHAGERVLRWNESISARIERIREELPQRGCPAYKQIVEIDGKKQPLIYAFWQALVNHYF